jgi:hypothetical protein
MTMNVIPQTITSRGIAVPMVVALLVLGFLGCGPSPEDVADGGDPLAALRVDAVSSRYDGRFWRLQHRQAPEVYAEAVAYCSAETEPPGERPNCEPVLRADEFIRNAERELSGQRGGRGYTGMLNEDVSDSEPAEDSSGSDREER